MIRKIPKAVSFFFFYLKEVVLANFQVAYDVLTPTHLMSPAVISLPLDEDLTELQLFLLSNLITMTPGTLSMDVSSDRRTLYIHAMYLENVEKSREDLMDYQRRIREVF